MIAFSLTERKALLITIDFVIVELTTLLALWVMAIRAGWVFDRLYLLDQISWFVFLPALWFLSAFLEGFYDPKKITDLGAAVQALLRSEILVFVVYFAIYFFFATPGSLPRGVVGYQGTASFALIGLWRLAYVWLTQRPEFARKVIIIGAGWAGQTIAQVMQEHAQAHYQIIGFIDDDPEKVGKAVERQETIACGTKRHPIHSTPLKVIGTSHDLVFWVKDQMVPELILAITRDISTPLFQSLLECKELGVRITLMPVLFEQLTGQVPIEHVGDNWNIALPLDSAEASGLYPLAKRFFDLVGAIIGLVLFSILFPIVALAIRLDSPGPIFYTQERVGRGGRIFKLVKLRTMIAHAETHGRALRAAPSDPRITRVGRSLRKTRLDEMPQLINVLKGEMSAVGPRPERPEHLAELDKLIPYHRLRNAVKPGMAGWAVVNYDYIDSIEDAKIRLQYDLYYVKHQSLWLDLLILLRTIGQMLTLRGR